MPGPSGGTRIARFLPWQERSAASDESWSPFFPTSGKYKRANGAPSCASFVLASASRRSVRRAINRKESTMADNLQQTGKPDDARINVEQDHELDYWSGKFGVTREEIRAAVKAVGPMVKDVGERLGRNRSY
jgi:hypothetical protein